MTDPLRTPGITAALARLEEAEVGLDQAIVAAKQVERQTPRTQLSEEDIRMIEEHARGRDAPRQLRELQERIDRGDLSWSDIAAGQHLDDPVVKAALSTGVEGMRQAYTLIEEGQHIDDVIAASAQPPLGLDEDPRRGHRDDGEEDDEQDGEGPVFRGVY